MLEEGKVSMILEKEEVVSEEKDEKEETVTPLSDNKVNIEETTTQDNLGAKSKEKRTKDNVVVGKTRRKRGLNDTLVNGKLFKIEEISVLCIAQITEAHFIYNLTYDIVLHLSKMKILRRNFCQYGRVV